MSKKYALALGLLAGCNGVQPVAPISKQPQTLPQHADRSAIYQQLQAEGDQVWESLREKTKTQSRMIMRCDEGAAGQEIMNQKFWESSVKDVCGPPPGIQQLMREEDPRLAMQEYQDTCATSMVEKKGDDGVNFLIQYYENELLRALSIQACVEVLEKLPLPDIDEQKIRSKIPFVSTVGEAKYVLDLAYLIQSEPFGKMGSHFRKPGQGNFEGLEVYIKRDFCGEAVPAVKNCFDQTKSMWDGFKRDHQAEIDQCDNAPPFHDLRFEDTGGACYYWVAEHNHPKFYTSYLRGKIVCEEMRTACMEQTLENLRD